MGGGKPSFIKDLGNGFRFGTRRVLEEDRKTVKQRFWESESGAGRRQAGFLSVGAARRRLFAEHCLPFRKMG